MWLGTEEVRKHEIPMTMNKSEFLYERIGSVFPQRTLRLMQPLPEILDITALNFHQFHFLEVS